MLRIDSEKTIEITRGDSATLTISAKDKSGEQYTFVNGDVIHLRVYEKGNTSNVVLDKFVTVNESTTSVAINLTHEDTTIGDLIDKPVTYSYEVEESTSHTTIIGHTQEEGAKKFILLPEAKEEE